VAAAFNRQFGYDDLGRLISTSTGALLWGTRTLTYDAMGNLKKTIHGITLNYSGTLPKLASAVENGVTTSVTYDPAGNELTATKSSVISPRNYIAQMSTPAIDYNYKYDGRGIRSWPSETLKPDTGTTTRRYHHYTPDLRFLARTDYTVTATSTTVARSIEALWFAGLPVAQIDYNDLATLRYTFTDHLGLPILQTSSLGAVIWQMEFEPYGRLYRVRTGKESAQPLRLPGQELTMDGKENYNVFRWYRGWWARYTQADMLGMPTWKEPNLFSYARENPARLSDALGLYTVDSSCCTCGPPNFGRVGSAVTQMCNNIRRPACREITRRLSLIPTMNGGNAEPLDSCLSRRCGNAQITVTCRVNTAPESDQFSGACGVTAPIDGTITLLMGNFTRDRGPGTRACPYERGIGWVPTLFEEAVHGCGLSQEPYLNQPMSPVFRSLMDRCADYGPENY
jgi:RHS repeat-associated protein